MTGIKRIGDVVSALALFVLLELGRPSQRHGGQWAMYAFDQREIAHVGKRSPEWTAVGETEVECVRDG